jgi:hypothetical protein
MVLSGYRFELCIAHYPSLLDIVHTFAPGPWASFSLAMPHCRTGVAGTSESQFELVTWLEMSQYAA